MFSFGVTSCFAYALTTLVVKNRSVDMKSSFSVGYQDPRRGKTIVITGVTSIVPNLNGVLFFVEDGDYVQIESHELTDGVLGNMFISYEPVSELADYTVVDHRAI